METASRAPNWLRGHIWPSSTIERRAADDSSARVFDTPIFSAISMASSISMPDIEPCTRFSYGPIRVVPHAGSPVDQRRLGSA